MPASATTWREATLEPSLISRKENALESRRVRTQPCTSMSGISASLDRACFTNVLLIMAQV